MCQCVCMCTEVKVRQRSEDGVRFPGGGITVIVSHLTCVMGTAENTMRFDRITLNLYVVLFRIVI